MSTQGFIGSVKYNLISEPPPSGYDTALISGTNVEFHYAGAERKMGFTDAQAYCNSQEGGVILAPTTSAENNFFINMLDDEEMGPVSRFWIGIDKSSGQWLETSGNSLEFENFQSGYGNSGTKAVATKTALNKERFYWKISYS